MQAWHWIKKRRSNSSSTAQQLETQGKLTPRANSQLLKRALAEAYEEGLRLSQMKISEEEAAPWALRTGRLIKAALEDHNRAQRFVEAEYKSITDPNQTKGQIWVDGCLNELYALYQEVNSLKPLKLRPDFDGREWVSKK